MKRTTHITKLAALALFANILVFSGFSLTPTSAQTSGLVAHYTFDDGTATDLSGNGNNGSVSGATLTSGKVGSGAMSFDGVDDYVSIPHHASLSPSAITLSFWAKVTSIPTTNNGSFIAKNVSADYRIRPGSNQTVQFLQNGGIHLTSSQHAYALGEWVHIVFTGDSSGMKFYQNGQLKGSNATAFVTPGSSANLRIGNLLAPVEMDDVRIYNRALSIEEVGGLYALGGGSIPPTEPPPSNPPPTESDPQVPPSQPVGTCEPGTYYIDYDAGNDGNDGKCTGTPWKHAPGDANATLNPKLVALKPGDKVVFKGGVVYKGTVNPKAPGNSSAYITYSGNSWPGISSRAILDGEGTRTSGIAPFETADYLTIEGFEIRNYRTAVSLTQYNFSTGDSLNNIRVLNNLLHDSYGVGAESTGRGIYFRYGSNLLIEGNIIHTLPYHAITVDGSHVTIRNNTIYNIWGDGIAAGIKEGVFIVEGNDIRDSVVGSTLHPDGIQLMHAPQGAIIRNNKIGNFSQQLFIENAVPTSVIGDVYVYNNIIYNTRPGVDGISGPGNGMIFKTRYSNWGDVYVIGNTCIYMNSGNGCIAGSGTSDGTLKRSMTVRNTIVYNSLLGIREGTQPNFSSDYNLFYNQHRSGYLAGFLSLDKFKTTYPTQEQHSLYGDPQFVNMTLLHGLLQPFDAKLRSASPAIDKGEARPGVGGVSFSSDHIAAARPQGNAWDIGAYESNYSGTMAPLVGTAGDFNKDGVVNSLDLSLMSGAWNTSNTTYDLSKDGTVNTLDYSIMVRNWTT
jgi:hypothetical protein